VPTDRAERRRVSGDRDPAFVGGDEAAAVIEDRPPCRGELNSPERLPARRLRVLRTLDHLERPEPERKHAEERCRYEPEDADPEVEARAAVEAGLRHRDRLDAEPPRTVRARGADFASHWHSVLLRLTDCPVKE
jgi:hypothetical protein